ncbi:hypothetical protein NM688_g6263 [Phlebia brevispora]|uniref:Uncharacterized protein n=1 Tax=Phlebia brevispora TaxID=194682 RepID=A0ACC1SHU5_9APHY|nr:hypothetical protein NM688_g6263 [Phlebia brevispora]
MRDTLAVTSLDIFVEDNLKTLYQATSKKVFDIAFESFFAEHLDVTVNGEAVSRAQYKQELWCERYAERNATVAFHGVLAVPSDNEHLNEAGTVAVFLTSAVQFVAPSGRPTQELVTASYRLIIEQDKSVEHHGERAQILEIRKVTSVDVVVGRKDESEDL